jgi:methyl-accepting chemotaxis protein
MNSLKPIGSFKANGPSDFEKIQNVHNINECIKLAHKGMGEEDNLTSDFFGYKDLDKEEIVNKINNCDDLLKYYKSLDCNDKKSVKPQFLSSTRFANQFPIIGRFQELGCKNKQAFKGVLDNACKIKEKYPHSECWLSSNDKTKNAIFGDNGDINIYVTPEDPSLNPKMSKQQLQLKKINNDISTKMDDMKALQNDILYNKLYKRAIKTGKTFDEVHKEYIDEQNNKEKNNTMNKISKLITNLSKKREKEATTDEILNSLLQEKNRSLQETKEKINNNNSTIDYINNRISYLSSKINTNNKEYTEKSKYLDYIKILIFVLIAALIIILIYKGKEAMPEIKKQVNKVVNTIKEVPSQIGNSVSNIGNTLSFDNINKMISQGFNF